MREEVKLQQQHVLQNFSGELQMCRLDWVESLCDMDPRLLREAPY